MGGIGYQEMRVVSFLYDRGRVRPSFPVLPFLPRGAGAVGSLGYPRGRAIVYQFNPVHVIEMTWLSVNHLIACPCSLEVNIMHHVCDTGVHSHHPGLSLSTSGLSQIILPRS